MCEKKYEGVPPCEPYDKKGSTAPIHISELERYRCDLCDVKIARPGICEDCERDANREMMER